MPGKDEKTDAAPAKKRRAPRKKKAEKANPFAGIAAKMLPKLDPKQVNRSARRLVIAYAEKDGITGEEKHARVVAELAKQLDKLLVWPATPAGMLTETIDGPALHLIAGFFVKHAHDALKGEGKIL